MQANSELFFKNDVEDLFDGYLRNLFGIRKTKDIFSNKKAGYGLDSYSKLTKEEKKFYTYVYENMNDAEQVIHGNRESGGFERFLKFIKQNGGRL